MEAADPKYPCLPYQYCEAFQTDRLDSQRDSNHSL